jgi:hypothetical protein
MLTNPCRSRYPYDCSALYQIIVNGRIDLTWSDRLEGMEIHFTEAETVSPVTILEGELSDQTALAGVLNTLYELHLTIVSVMRLDV